MDPLKPRLGARPAWAGLLAVGLANPAHACPQCRPAVLSGIFGDPDFAVKLFWILLPILLLAVMAALPALALRPARRNHEEEP